jgi:hypothetical protein
LEAWLSEQAEISGRSRGSLVKESLERARREKGKSFMALAGSVEGSRGLSGRKGFSGK